MALSKKNRLKKQSDFQEVFKKGRAIGANFLFIKVKENSLAVDRFGFVIPSRIIKNAVGRNRIKRILTETVRINLSTMKQGYDVIVGLRKPEATPKLKDDLLKLIKKAGLI